jgi:hypothetical protein
VIGHAHAIKMGALRRLGEMLEPMEKNTGARGIGTSAVPVGNHTPPTYSEIGLSKKTAMVAQRAAAKFATVLNFKGRSALCQAQSQVCLGSLSSINSVSA